MHFEIQEVGTRPSLRGNTVFFQLFHRCTLLRIKTYPYRVKSCCGSSRSPLMYTHCIHGLSLVSPWTSPCWDIAQFLRQTLSHVRVSLIMLGKTESIMFFIFICTCPPEWFAVNTSIPNCRCGTTACLWTTKFLNPGISQYIHVPMDSMDHPLFRHHDHHRTSPLDSTSTTSWIWLLPHDMSDISIGPRACETLGRATAAAMPCAAAPGGESGNRKEWRNGAWKTIKLTYTRIYI